MTPHQGRGRPQTFTPGARSRYLAAVASGATLAEAAASVGVAERTVRDAVKADPQFASARERAREDGRETRIRLRTERTPHGEYRYIHHHCRCDICTTAATDARAGRRSQQPTAPVVALGRPTPTPEPPRKPNSFSLAKAS